MLKKHEKHVQKTRAENKREKQGYRKNKPVQKIRAEKTGSQKTRVQKKQPYRKNKYRKNNRFFCVFIFFRVQKTTAKNKQKKQAPKIGVKNNKLNTENMYAENTALWRQKTNRKNNGRKQDGTF